MHLKKLGYEDAFTMLYCTVRSKYNEYNTHGVSISAVISVFTGQNLAVNLDEVSIVALF